MHAAANHLFFGDNLEIMRERIAGNSVDLVYLDPPFNSNRNYNVIFNRHGEAKDGNAGQIQAFSDAWRWTHAAEEQYAAAIGGGLPSRAADALAAMRALLGENDAMAYLVNMAPRLVELRRALKPTGSLYLHCDPTMSHYLKILLDAIFGPENFRNEIIWCYFGPSNTKRWFPRKHDVILFYARSDDAVFNLDAVRVPYKLPPPGLVTGSMHGLRRQPKPDVAERVKRGKVVEDYWTDITALAASNERLGYPTQKPVALLERIIAASSNPGDVVLDPFCGCGTTIDAAHRLGRRWTGIDITYIAIDLIDKRLKHRYPGITDYEIHGIPKDMGGARALFGHSPFDFERWAVSQVGAQPNEKQVGDKGTDGTGRFPLDSKGSVGKMLVSVKGGKTVGPTAVRDLSGTVHAQKAQMGVLVTMEPPTRGVTDAADHGGSYTWPPNGQTFPRIQVITVAELLTGKRPGTPPLLLPYVAAVKAHIPVVQHQLVPEGT